MCAVGHAKNALATAHILWLPTRPLPVSANGSATHEAKAAVETYMHGSERDREQRNETGTTGRQYQYHNYYNDSNSDSKAAQPIINTTTRCSTDIRDIRNKIR
jgi:hypothetical protein